MRKTKIFGLALGLIAVIAMAQPAQAACGAPFQITQTRGNTFSYLINPTVALGGAGVDGSSVTAALTGVFYALGLGDPNIGVGADNGTFQALDWVYIYTNYPASIATTWAADPGIDTCIDAQGPLGQRCQITFVQDVDPSNGETYSALISTPDDPASGDFFLDNGGVDITMALFGPMVILNSARQGDTGVAVEFSGPSIDDLVAGAYLSDASQCQGVGGGGTGDPLNGLVTHYAVAYQMLPRGSEPPTDPRVENWDIVPGPPSRIGEPTTVPFPCSGDTDIYATTQLIFNSNADGAAQFSSPLVSLASTNVECGPNVADPQDRIRLAPEGRQKPTRSERTR